MIEVTLVNTLTGETKTLQGQVRYAHPWKVQSITKTGPRSELKARLAVLATKVGLPVPDMLDAARWILQKDCPYCQMGTQVLRAVEQLGEERAQEAIGKILVAKELGDLAGLEAIRKQLWPSETQTSQTQP